MTAAVAGVIANLALWFALHFLFARMTDGPAATELPVIESLDARAAALSVVALALAFGARAGMPVLIGVMALLGLAVSQLAG